MSNKENPPLKYGVNACRWSVLKKHFSQNTAISERMASVTLQMFSSLSSSRRWTSACSCGRKRKSRLEEQNSRYSADSLNWPWTEKRKMDEGGSGIFSPLPGSSSWMWPCGRWRPLSPAGAPAVCPTAAGSSLCDSHISPHSPPCVPPAAGSTGHKVASVTNSAGGTVTLQHVRPTDLNSGDNGAANSQDLFGICGKWLEWINELIHKLIHK